MAQDNWLFLSELRGGRNGIDPPVSLRDVECVEAVNVDWYNALLARKRKGAVVDSTLTGTALTGVISWLGRHVPSSDDTVAELWRTDDSATPKIERVAGGVACSAPTLKEVPTGNGWDFSAASLNGYYFLAYKSASDRLKVWDPNVSQVRLAGLSAPLAAPTAVNTGIGTLTTSSRAYRVRFTVQNGGITTRRSEYSSTLIFVPSGTGASVTVTRPAVVNEGETHWELEGSPDNANFYRIATIAIGTTTSVDSLSVADFPSFTISPTTGLYTVQKSYRFIAADQNRLLGFGSYTATDKQNRIEISDVAGSLNIGDVERVPTSSYVDLDENDSGAPTGMLGPVNGSYFAFKYRQVWKLTPTGNVLTPYSAVCLSKHIGAIHQKSITVSEDENGNPTIYWMSHRGPYRFGSNGLEYIGKGVEDRVLLLNLAATKVPAHTLYLPDLRQIWFYIATGSNNDPDTKLCWQIGRSGGTAVSDHPVPSGWAVHNGGSANARASVMFSNTMGATMSRDLKPYIAYAGASVAMWKCDTGTDDNGTPFQAYVTTKVFYPWGLMRNGTINRAYVLGVAVGTAIAPVTVRLTIIPDYDTANARTFDTTLSPIATETRIRKRWEDAATGDVGAVQFTIGDAAAVSNTWQLDSAVFEIDPKDLA